MIDSVEDYMGTVAKPGDIIVLGRRQHNSGMLKTGRIRYFKPGSRHNEGSMRVEWFNELCTGYGNAGSTSIQIRTDRKNDFFVLHSLVSYVDYKYPKDEA